MARLLCITAHPDDEAGGFGGSLRLYADRGVETYVLCLTEGRAATHRGGAASGEELARLRCSEFDAACKILGVTRGEVLTYPDGALDRQNLLAVTGDLARRIRQLRPDVVMTFGPEGAITAHPDHSMTSVFATLAFHWAGRTNRFTEQLEREGLQPHRAHKLYYATADFTMPERQPVSLAPATCAVDIRHYVDVKRRAFRAHTSQAPLFPFFEAALERRGETELFHLAASITPREINRETDLFAGVVRLQREQ